MIEVFADWTESAAPEVLGTLRARRTRAAELFDFEFNG